MMVGLISLFFWLLFIFSVGVYFIPSIVAIGKPNALAIFFLNLFLGWTFVGWVGALVWAIVSENTASVQPKETPADTMKCPYCAETIKAEAKLCRFCGKDLPPKSEPTQTPTN